MQKSQNVSQLEAISHNERKPIHIFVCLESSEKRSHCIRDDFDHVDVAVRFMLLMILPIKAFLGAM